MDNLQWIQLGYNYFSGRLPARISRLGFKDINNNCFAPNDITNSSAFFNIQMRPASDCAPYLNDASLPDTVALPPFSPAQDDSPETPLSPSNTATTSDSSVTTLGTTDASATSDINSESLSVTSGSSFFVTIATARTGGTGGSQVGGLFTTTGSVGVGGNDTTGNASSTSFNLPLAIAVPFVAVAVILAIVGALLVRRRKFGKISETRNIERNRGNEDYEGGPMTSPRFPGSSDLVASAAAPPSVHNDVTEIKALPAVVPISGHLERESGNRRRERSSFKPSGLLSNLDIEKHSPGITQVQIVPSVEKPMIGIAETRHADVL
ncbi:hypothetical protein BC829DRAFT_17227 [Chytridium lagenaria]|nr:hypothetical protein BC829DRAFT_17227 [Chytridium lagenaria]